MIILRYSQVAPPLRRHVAPLPELFRHVATIGNESSPSQEDVAKRSKCSCPMLSRPLHPHSSGTAARLWGTCLRAWPLSFEKINLLKHNNLKGKCAKKMQRFRKASGGQIDKLRYPRMGWDRIGLDWTGSNRTEHSYSYSTRKWTFAEVDAAWLTTRGNPEVTSGSSCRCSHSTQGPSESHPTYSNILHIWMFRPDTLNTERHRNARKRYE